MFGCRTCNLQCKYCMGPEKTNNEKFILDENRLKSAIDLLIQKESILSRFFIWGGEPLIHFEELKSTVDFLRNNYPERKIAFSTNGVLLSNKKIQNFIISKKLRVQLSVDGLAQSYRSNFNPLEDNSTSVFLVELTKENLLSINCVMHKYNYSIKKNIQYFTNWMKKYDCLDSNLNIRFTPINESNLTPDYNLSGKRLKSFIHEYEILYLHALLGKKNDSIYKHFIRFPLKIIKESNLKKCKWEYTNHCTKFATGIISISKHIDTKGNFISCNLIDSGIKPRGKEKKLIPEYCYKCKYKMTRGCWPCPAADFTEKCEFKKTWMQFQERMILLKKLIRNKKSIQKVHK